MCRCWASGCISQWINYGRAGTRRWCGSAVTEHIHRVEQIHLCTKGHITMVTSEVFTQSRWCFFVTMLWMQESPCYNAESSSEVLLLLVLTVFRCAIQPLVMTSLCTSPISHLFHSLHQGSLFVRIYLTSVWVFHTSFNCTTIQFWSHDHTNTHTVSKGSASPCGCQNETARGKCFVGHCV